MRDGIIRLVVLLVWALIVLATGGIAIRAGFSLVLVGGVELLALVGGIGALMTTAAWTRSIERSRNRV